MNIAKRVDPYNSQTWIRKARFQKAREPLCAECLKSGIVRAGQIADHIKPWKTAKNKRREFLNGKLQTLCKEHHQEKRQASSEEQLINKRRSVKIKLWSY